MTTGAPTRRTGATAPAMRAVRRHTISAALSICCAALTATAAFGVPPAKVVPPAVNLTADATALILCGTTCPTPDAFWIEAAKNHFVAPTHPGQNIDYVAVTAPMTLWPLTGVMRLLGFALGDPRLFGPGGGAWPDQNFWQLSGLFDPTANQSVEQGAADLQTAMAAHGNDDLIVYGYSQGAGVANVVKKRLAEKYPAENPGSSPPTVDFVLGGDPNLPNGGLMSRFPGLYIPVLDMSFNGPAVTDTAFNTVEINRQYDGFSDLPLYPLNLISTMNALMGMFYVHTWPLATSLPPDPTSSPAYQGTHGDTSYYFFATPDLPLFGPLRTLGVPEKLIDVVEPVFRVLVELGYDRTIPPWEPTPARLIPQHDPGTVVKDLTKAIREGIDNAAVLPGAPAAEVHSVDGPPAAPVADIAEEVRIADAPTTTRGALPAAGATSPTATHTTRRPQSRPAEPSSSRQPKHPSAAAIAPGGGHRSGRSPRP